MQEMRFTTLYPRAMHYFATRTIHPMPPLSKHNLESKLETILNRTICSEKRIYTKSKPRHCRPLSSSSTSQSTIYNGGSFASQLKAKRSHILAVPTRSSICNAILFIYVIDNVTLMTLGIAMSYPFRARFRRISRSNITTI